MLAFKWRCAPHSVMHPGARSRGVVSMVLLRSVSLIVATAVLAGCQPSVRVEAPREPITINLNVKVDAEVRVKLEEQAEKDIRNAPEIF